MRSSDAELYTAVQNALQESLAGTGKEPTKRQQRLLARAKASYYNDYFGVPAMPQIALLDELRQCGLDQLAPDVINGRFDGTKAEADEWAQTEEGREARAAFGFCARCDVQFRGLIDVFAHQISHSPLRREAPTKPTKSAPNC